MKKEKYLWEQSDILNANYRRKSIIDKDRENLNKYDTDVYKSARKAKALCKYCYYYNTSRIGGCMITSKPCCAEGCDQTLTFGNTCTDVFCTECATKLKLCKHCGGKLD